MSRESLEDHVMCGCWSSWLVQAMLLLLMCGQFELDARGVALTGHTTRD